MLGKILNWFRFFVGLVGFLIFIPEGIFYYRFDGLYSILAKDGTRIIREQFGIYLFLAGMVCFIFLVEAILRFDRMDAKNIKQIFRIKSALIGYIIYDDKGRCKFETPRETVSLNTEQAYQLSSEIDELLEK
jgi:hypothetical protein